MQLNCKVTEKVATSPFLLQPPFQGYSPFLAKFLVPPQVTQFLEDPTPLPPLVRGERKFNYEGALVSVNTRIE